jgi:hypothetical protein
MSRPLPLISILIYHPYHTPPSNLAQEITFLIILFGGHSVRISPGTSAAMTVGIHGFPLSLQINAGIVPLIRPRTTPSIFLVIHYLLPCKPQKLFNDTVAKYRKLHTKRTRCPFHTALLTSEVEANEGTHNVLTI